MMPPRRVFGRLLVTGLAAVAALLLLPATGSAAPVDPDTPIRCRWVSPAILLAEALADATDPLLVDLRDELDRQGITVDTRPPSSCRRDGSGSSAGGRSTGSDASTPGELLDLQDWYLTLPTGSDGSPETVEQPDLGEFSNEYFKLDDDRGGVVFRANAGGVTTENSEYPRSELREMNGSEHAAWSNASGTHTLEARESITEVPQAKPEVVAAQIHGGDDDVLQIRLEGNTLSAQYADGEEQTVLDPDYQLGTPYDLRIVAADSQVTVFYNGDQKAAIKESGSSWYWKIGAYIQSNPDKGDDADAAAEVVVHSLSIEHSDQ